MSNITTPTEVVCDIDMEAKPDQRWRAYHLDSSGSPEVEGFGPTEEEARRMHRIAAAWLAEGPGGAWVAQEPPVRQLHAPQWVEHRKIEATVRQPHLDKIAADAAFYEQGAPRPKSVWQKLRDLFR